ncbi:MAG: hypothetical protein ABI604_13725 [Nitrospirota bacterium]
MQGKDNNTDTEFIPSRPSLGNYRVWLEVEKEKQQGKDAESSVDA